ncbi:hypothetical protein MBANPS3_010885 [Mucor bainieri]
MTMQAVTIGILNKALLTGIKSNLVIANMIHSMYVCILGKFQIFAILESLVSTQIAAMMTK